MPTLLWYMLAGVVVFGLLVYWLLVTTEGTYLGARLVAWLYDLTAGRYDRIKAVQYPYELRFIGIPLMEALEVAENWRLLDVACGTGRVAAALAGAGNTGGRLYGVDRSIGMLRLASQMAAQSKGKTEYARQDAMALGFHDGVFDGVCCLEALEFMQRPQHAVREMLRVLKPNGTLLLSNRVGFDAWLFPGRICRRGRLEAYLKRIGLGNITSQRWQVDYDLVWATKPATEGVYL